MYIFNILGGKSSMTNTANTTESLNRIADILEKSTEISFLQTVAGQFTILVIGAVVGAIVGALTLIS